MKKLCTNHIVRPRLARKARLGLGAPDIPAFATYAIVDSRSADSQTTCEARHGAVLSVKLATGTTPGDSEGDFGGIEMPRAPEANGKTGFAGY